MSEEKRLAKIKFQVAIDTSITPPIFTFYNESHHATNGNAVAYLGEETHVIYVLATPGFFFVEPFVTNNFSADIHYGISDEGQKLTVVDNGNFKEEIGLQLIVEQLSSGQRYASPDPQIRNTKRT